MAEPAVVKPPQPQVAAAEPVPLLIPASPSAPNALQPLPAAVVATPAVALPVPKAEVKSTPTPLSPPGPAKVSVPVSASVSAPATAAAPRVLPAAVKSGVPLAAPSVLPATQAVAQKVAPLSELPEELRRQIPPLVITGVVYSDSPAQSLLLVNKLVLTQGNLAAPEVMLERIYLHHAVFSFKGTQFTLSY